MNYIGEDVNIENFLPQRVMDEVARNLPTTWEEMEELDIGANQLQWFG
jgi:hypothetical protein